MQYGIRIATAPTVEPVTRAEAKLHLRVVADEENTLIDNLITAARVHAEQLTGRQLCTATWDYFADGFPRGLEPLQLPLAPLQSVTTLKYYDADGAQQTWSSSNYIVSINREPGTIRLAYQTNWPLIRYRPDAVEIRFVAGYGAASAVPMAIKQAMLMLIGHWFEHRESVVIGTISSDLPQAATMLLSQYKLGDEWTCYGPENYATA